MPSARILTKECTLVALVTLVFYLLVLSRGYAGDGVRYLPELSGPRPEFGMNLHVMFPALFWGVAEIGRKVGLTEVLGHQFQRPGLVVLCQSLSAALAALGVAAFHLWQRTAGGRVKPALLFCGVLALSNAYALHATDMTEPIAAVPWVLGAAALLRFYPGSLMPAAIAGALVGVGATFYLAALFGCALLGSVAVERYLTTGSWRRALGVATAIGGAAISTYVLLFVSLSWVLRPETPLVGVVASTVQFPTDHGLYGSIDPRHLVGAAFGFANGWAPLAAFEGAARLLESKPAVLAYNVGITFASVVFGLGLIATLVRHRAQILGRNSAGDVVGSLVWLTAVFLLAATWSPTYEKIWLFGVLATVCLVSTMFDRSEVRSRREWWPVCVMVSLAFCSLTMGILPRRFGANRDLEGAAMLAARVLPSDLLICPGWDPTSMYYKTLNDPPRQCWAIVDNAVGAELDAKHVSDSLTAAITRAIEERRSVYFIGLLDLSEKDWEPFYERRLQMPFGLLSPYRAEAQLAFEIPGAGGATRPVFRYCGASGC
jgi:hypothetical protein